MKAGVAKMVLRQDIKFLPSSTDKLLNKHKHVSKCPTHLLLVHAALQGGRRTRMGGRLGGVGGFGRGGR